MSRCPKTAQDALAVMQECVDDHQKKLKQVMILVKWIQTRSNVSNVVSGDTSNGTAQTKRNQMMTGLPAMSQSISGATSDAQNKSVW